MKGNIKKQLSDTSLIKLLKSFTPKEISEFDKFICSPFFNSHSTLTKLFREIKNFYPDFSDINFTREFLFKKINNNKEYNDIIFRKYLSNLLKLSETFLIVNDTLQNKERKTTFLLDQYERRNLYNSFYKVIKREEETGGEHFELTNETFYNLYYREELKSSLNIRSNKISFLKTNLIKSHMYLLLQLLLSSSVYSNMMIVTRKSYKDSEENRFFEEFFEVFDIIRYLENSEFINKTESLFIQLCKSDILLLKNPFDKDELIKMNEILIKISSKLNKNLLYIFFSHLNIYFLLNISNGREEYSLKLFENYKFMISKELYVFGDRKFISFSEYRTLLLHSLKMKKYQWAEDFINEYKDHHFPEMRDEIAKYSKVVLNFETGNYPESLKYLSKIKSNDMVIKTDTDIIRLMIFYEQGLFDSADSFAESFKHYLKVNKVFSKEIIKSQFDFIKYLKILIKIKQKGIVDYEYDNLKKEISECKNLRRKSWILEKLGKLQKEINFKSSRREKPETAAL